MKQSASIAIAVVVAGIVAGAGGYLAGSRETSVQADGTVKQERKPLYYRNPMGLPDTSPVPKKDPMGMDYIPVYEGEQEETSSGKELRISTEKVQKLGVRTEKATQRAIDKVVRAAGRVEPDERRVFIVAPKFEGYVERLHVNATGQPVGKGQPLFEVYSPELVSAQREYAIAAQGLQSLKGADSDAQAGMRQLADSSLLRLRNWDISEEQIKALAKSGDAKRTMTFRSPVSGIVTEKKAVQGMRFMPGEMLYQISDLSTVWVFADVFEQDIGLVKAGTQARVRINAYSDKEFDGKVTYVYPTLNAGTRTAQVRIELANPGQLLKPGMFANVELAAAARSAAVTVPVSAVIDSGTRRIVLVQREEGRFEPREVRLGARSDDHVEVLEGVQDGGRGRCGQLPDRRGKQPQGRDRRLWKRAETGRRRPQGGGQDRRDRSEVGHGQHRARPGREPEVAGDDHGVQGRQQCLALEHEAGRPGQLRVRRAPAGRMGDHRIPAGTGNASEGARPRCRPARRPSLTGSHHAEQDH